MENSSRRAMGSWRGKGGGGSLKEWEAGELNNFYYARILNMMCFATKKGGRSQDKKGRSQGCKVCEV